MQSYLTSPERFGQVDSFKYHMCFYLDHILREILVFKCARDKKPLDLLRDWSLITGRGGLQNGKIAGPKLFAPPSPQDRVKLFASPLLKSGNFSRPP